jgi:hypothetical protein
MPSILSDPPAWLSWGLIIVAVLGLLAAFFLTPAADPKQADAKKRRSRQTILFAVSAVALLLWLGLKATDYFFESDAEQIQRKLREMSEGVHERNSNKIFQHVSESFRYGSSDKAALRHRGEQAQETGQVTDIPIWDVNVQPIPKGATTATVIFRFKVNGNALRENQFLCRTQFVKDPDGQWRLQGFEVFPPTGLKDSYSVPGL